MAASGLDGANSAFVYPELEHGIANAENQRRFAWREESFGGHSESVNK